MSAGTQAVRISKDGKVQDVPESGNLPSQSETVILEGDNARAANYIVRVYNFAAAGPYNYAEALQKARRFTVQRADSLEQKLPAAKRRTHLCARLRGSLRLIPVEDVRYLQAEEKYVVVHHARGEDLIEESLKALEDEFGDRFVRIHRNCLVARHELVELKRGLDGHVHAILRHGDKPLEVSRRCVAQLRDTIRQL